MQYKLVQLFLQSETFTDLEETEEFKDSDSISFIKESVINYDTLSKKGIFDFAIVIGGDGTILHYNYMLNEYKPMPPILGIAKVNLLFILSGNSKLSSLLF